MSHYHWPPESWSLHHYPHQKRILRTCFFRTKVLHCCVQLIHRAWILGPHHSHEGGWQSKSIRIQFSCIWLNINSVLNRTGAYFSCMERSGGRQLRTGNVGFTVALMTQLLYAPSSSACGLHSLCHLRVWNGCQSPITSVFQTAGGRKRNGGCSFPLKETSWK